MKKKIQNTIQKTLNYNFGIYYNNSKPVRIVNCDLKGQNRQTNAKIYLWTNWTDVRLFFVLFDFWLKTTIIWLIHFKPNMEGVCNQFYNWYANPSTEYEIWIWMTDCQAVRVCLFACVGVSVCLRECVGVRSTAF